MDINDELTIIQDSLNIGLGIRKSLRIRPAHITSLLNLMRSTLNEIERDVSDRTPTQVEIQFAARAAVDLRKLLTVKRKFDDEYHSSMLAQTHKRIINPKIRKQTKAELS